MAAKAFEAGQCREFMPGFVSSTQLVQDRKP